MPLQDSLSSRLSSIKPIYLTAIPATLATLLLLRSLSVANRIPDPKQQTVLESPLHALTIDEADDLAYAPDSIPGARDVESPWGRVRVYEWGPLTGKKVLLVHGISIPSVALSKVAAGLVEKGCRVMLFGMFSSFALGSDMGAFALFLSPWVGFVIFIKGWYWCIIGTRM
jgi:hypothetical protein